MEWMVIVSQILVWTNLNVVTKYWSGLLPVVSLLLEFCPLSWSYQLESTGTSRIKLRTFSYHFGYSSGSRAQNWFHWSPTARCILLSWTIYLLTNVTLSPFSVKIELWPVLSCYYILLVMQKLYCCGIFCDLCLASLACSHCQSKSFCLDGMVGMSSSNIGRYWDLLLFCLFGAFGESTMTEYSIRRSILISG